MTVVTSVVSISIFALAIPIAAFECAIFPGEGPHSVNAPGGEIVLRAAPSHAAGESMTISPAKGTSLRWSETRFRTLTPGRFYARESGTMQGSAYGPVSFLSRQDYYRGRFGWGTFSYAKGDSIEYLQYRAEGSFLLRIAGNVIGAELLSKRAVPLKEVRRPELELWIRLTDQDGDPSGWYQVPGDQLHTPRAGGMSPGPEFMP